MTELDELFKTARTAGPPPSADLMSRVLADAERIQAQRGAAMTPVRAQGPEGAGGTGPWAWVLGLFGGVGPFAGVVTAGIAGLMLGYAQPSGLSGLTAMLVPATAVSQTVELMPGLETLLTEE